MTYEITEEMRVAFHSIFDPIYPSLPVKVGELVIHIPEDALKEGSRFLSLSTEGYVSLEDYAQAIGITLYALEKSKVIRLCPCA